MMPDNQFSEAFLTNKTVRKEIMSCSHRHFFSYCLSHYVQHKIAPFQEQLFAVTENEVLPLAVITAFRNSAKSTIITTSYTMWATLGVQQKKFVVIVCQTQQQGRMHLRNIRRELESNSKLIADYGPFADDSDEWTADSIYLPKIGARIMAISIDQSPRGIRLGQYRPDLIICDDIENMDSVKTLESRNNTYQKLVGDIFPTKAQGARIIVVGNLLHEDSALQRLSKAIDDDKLDGQHYHFPLLDDYDNIAWLGKYPDVAAIEAEKRTIGDEITWQREFLLKIIPPDYQLIRHEDIIYYTQEDLDVVRPYHLFDVMSVDPAASTDPKADKTAIVSASVFEVGDDIKIYIHPYPINQQLDFPGIMEAIVTQHSTLHNSYSAEVFVENVAAQSYITQALDRIGIPAEGISVTQDKRTRLSATTHALRRGQVLFPEVGAEVLITQLIGFGVERYDDQADAFSLLVNGVFNKKVSVFHADRDVFFGTVSDW